MYNQNGQNEAVSLIRTMAVSVLFLVGAIGYSVYVLFELLGGIAGGSGIVSLINRIMVTSGGYSSMDYNAMQAISGVLGGMTVLSTLVSMLPALVIAAGVWLVFAAAKRNVFPGNAPVGLTMARVVVIIQLVFACIGIAIVELVCIIFMASMNSVTGYYGMTESLTGFLVLGMIALAAVAVVQIIYYLKLSGTIKRIKETLLTGQPDAGISLYVEIICYIGGATSALAALMSLVGLSVYGLLANAGLSTANICFAILLRQYRDKMKLLIQNPQQLYQTQVQERPQQIYQARQEASQQMYQTPQQEVPQQMDQSAQQSPQRTGAAYGETDVLPYYNETTVLSGQIINDGMLQTVRLIREKTGETICINKPSFWLGKEAGNVDYCITDNTAISRRHALITIRNNECYIRDNHSTNHVFLNGRVLESGVDTLLSDNDRVRMGDEEFTISIG